MNIQCANCQRWLGDAKKFCSASLGPSCLENETCHFIVWSDDILEYDKDGEILTVVCPRCGLKNVFITHDDGSIEARLK